MTEEDRTESHHVDRLQSRTLRDPHGVVWTVQEIAQWGYDRRRMRSLIFENSDAMRRIRTYPPNWMELTDEELWEVARGR